MKPSTILSYLFASDAFNFADFGANLKPSRTLYFSRGSKKINNRSKYIPAGKNKNIPEGNR